ncbi:putative bifunctional diguanylate cyclase/phosphodiesterase [Sphingomonas baiyangensis]|uniref:EAL domain-containing protein n=1 Tax=Sphingomonas baiyangensis TaxID=2572576 RepID=A0A4U1L406_9SPHN|nr:EAL domain-containing protein [Sphingomonas baiyangensis]TKD50970.1 EAL domain-containing protein [Sphingomonas baiyangensis]
MEGHSLKSRAIVFAVCAGAIAFILALFATSNDRPDADSAARALIAAIVCAVLCWAAAERALAQYAGALDQAIARMTRAAQGDLESAVPSAVSLCVPELADSMQRLFGRLHETLGNVQRMAMYDPVTALPNRTHFRQTAEALLADREAAAPAALFFIDLDRFKSVNDTLGHATGDMLLGMVANRLRAVGDRFAHDGAHGAPLIGRLAGDEFTMLFADLADPADAERIGRAILSALADPFDLPEREVRIGASIGIASRPDHGASLPALMRAADAAMYRAKEQGRGRAERYSTTLAAEIADRAQLERDLRHAMEREQFTMVFQPQLDARDGRVVGAEALLRWNHPAGLKLPASFIQRAEESGLIVEIGEWVVGSVAATIARWAALGVQQRMAVNISRREIDNVQFFHRLRAALHGAGAPAALLELEITEQLAMHCSDAVLDAIAALRADGASIAIDDFGTGYSNLARLRELPIDRVKLDRSLTEKVAGSAEARTIAQAVINLVHGLNCEVVGEGIESSAQADVLRVIGCDVLQGYALAAPMDEAAFLAWLRLPRAAAPLSRALGR